MKKRVDLGTIAEKVGVSKTTVHYALHQPERLGKETLEKVLAAVKELGYRPNLLARSLRTRRSNIVGIICTRLDCPYFAPFFEVTARAAQEFGYAVFAGTSGGCAARERELVELALAHGIDGVIILPNESEENGDFYRDLLGEQAPFIFVEHSVPGVETDCVGTDDFLGGQIVARRLVEVGRRKVAFLAPPGEARDCRWVCDRRDGCNQALAEAGIEPAAEMDHGSGEDPRLDRCGYEATRHCLSSNDGYDGLFAANDALAWGALQASAEAGLEVGRDLSVIGFDDSQPDSYVAPPLSSMRHPLAEIGREAMRLLLVRIEEPSAPPTRALLAPELVIRSSCMR